MSYSNPFLADFQKIFFEILRIKEMNPAKIEVAVIDEEIVGQHIFERMDVRDVLYELGPKLNALTIYTDRPAYFLEYVQKMDDENGLIVSVFSKKNIKANMRMQSKSERLLILDFEWKGNCRTGDLNGTCAYLPIHKKPWKVAENLDIIVPFSYNTVIVKSNYANDKKFVNDRFDEGFYRDELFYKEG